MGAILKWKKKQNTSQSRQLRKRRAFVQAARGKKTRISWANAFLEVATHPALGTLTFD